MQNGSFCATELTPQNLTRVTPIRSGAWSCGDRLSGNITHRIWRGWRTRLTLRSFVSLLGPTPSRQGRAFGRRPGPGNSGHHKLAKPPAHPKISASGLSDHYPEGDVLF